MRNMVEHALDSQHALRATKPTKGRSALRIGFQTMAFDAAMRQMIGIIGM